MSGDGTSSDASARDETDHFVEFCLMGVALHFEVVVGLDIDPEAIVDSQCLGQA